MPAGALATVLKVLAIPAIVVAYIAVAGTTGFCPNCTKVVDTVLGRGGSTGATQSIAGLTARDLDGGTVKLDDYLGRPVILDFWATWCPPCLKQRQVFAAMASELEESAQLVALSVDQGGPDAVKAHLADSDHAIGVELMATDELSRLFNVSAIPTLVFVDAQGNVREVVTGSLDAAAIRTRLAKLKS